MTVTAWIPLDRYLTGWAENLFPVPDLSTFAVVDHQTRVEGGITTSTFLIEVLADVTLALPGIDVVTAQLLPAQHGSQLTIEVDWTGPFAVRAVDLGVDLVVTSPLLVPVSGEPGAWVKSLREDGTPDPMRVTLTVGSVELDGAGGIHFSEDGALALPPFMIGDTGFVAEVTAARLSFSGDEPPPDTSVVGFRGLLFEAATLYFPDGVDLPAILPGSIEVLDGAIGTGGFSGAFVGSWDVQWDATTPSGDGAGSLFGFGFGLDSMQLQVEQDCVTAAALLGHLAVPFFDQVLTVAVAVETGGEFSITVTGTPDAEPVLAPGSETTTTTPAVVTLTLPGVGTLRVTALGLVRDEDGVGLLLSGELELQVGAPALTWPTITVQNLRIDPDGHVAIAGGWLDLQQPIALDLYGFGLEITRVGFGSEDDGRRWVGVDGALRLTELLPAGASARGLRVIWDPSDPLRPPTLSMDGIGVSFGVPDAFGFAGEVALTDDPATGAKLFTGALALGLDALDVGIDAGITIGRLGPDTYVFVHLGVNLPIPLGATGAALYGLEGLFAMNLSPLVANAPWPSVEAATVPRGDWYGWYKTVPKEFTATDPLKWSADAGAWAFGAGLSLGTLPDAGFTVNTRALLVVLLPGPVLLLQGTADLFTPPPALGGSTQEGTLSLLAALDGTAGTLQLGIDAAWSLARVLDIAASTEAFFDFDRSDAWHVWIGQDRPESARIRADFLALFHADAWLMLSAAGVDTGLGVSWGDTWKYGPARVGVEAWIGGKAGIVTRPQHLSGRLSLGGQAEVAAGPFGIGMAVQAALAGESFTPYQVGGTLSVAVELPMPLKDLDLDIDLRWQQPATPSVEDPWLAALVEHARCTESWVPVDGGDTAVAPAPDAPVVPLDAGVVLTFAKPMGDTTGVADNPPVGTPALAIGEHESSYAVTALSLHRWRRSHPGAGWEDVTDTVFGTWVPDHGDAGSRLQLFTRSPFAFTRFTSRRWVDDFVRRYPDWPCLPEPPALPTCVDWTAHPVESRLPALWVQRGATFSSEAALSVLGLGEFGRVLWLGRVEGEPPRPGALWVALPEPAQRVTALVSTGGGWVWLRAWSDGVLVGSDSRLRDSGLLQVDVAGLDSGGIDTVTLDWGFHVETELAQLCWTPLAAGQALGAWTTRQERLDVAAERWQSAEQLLDPDSHYLLEVTTLALLTRDGEQVQREEGSHAVQFQTGGPPGVVPDWVGPAPPETTTATTGFPYGGVLRDLAGYLRWTIPAAGAAPVFRGYDLGCEFDVSSVQQLYGADLRIVVRDRNGLVVRDGEGAEVVFANSWAAGPTTTLSSQEVSWLDRLGACTQSVDLGALRGNDLVQAALPAGYQLPARQTLTARLEATRPLFTDAFDDLAAFDAQVLSTGESVSTCSASGGTAIIARKRSDTATVVALAGDAQVADYTLECTAGPAGEGSFGLVLRHTGPQNYLALELTPGAGRMLVAYQGSGPGPSPSPNSGLGPRVLGRVLWQDDQPVEVGSQYALTVTCTGSQVTGAIDGVAFGAGTTLERGRFGLLSGVAAPQGCAFTGLVVRSAPYVAVHEWQFTTSAHPGLPELLATSTGETWPVDGAAVDRARLSAEVATAATALAVAQAGVEAARAELATAVADGDMLDLDALRAAALAAVEARHDTSVAAYDAVVAALGLPYRVLPPVVELSAVTDGEEVVGLLVDLPEPIAWERVSWTVRRLGRGRPVPVTDLVLAWSDDGARAVLVRDDGSAFRSADWTLELTMALDAGAERAVWLRAGSSARELGELRFTTP
jgi:hypothetical protein